MPRLRRWIGGIASEGRFPAGVAAASCNAGSNLPLNRSSRRQEAPSELRYKMFEPPHVGCYDIQGTQGPRWANRLVIRCSNCSFHPSSGRFKIHCMDENPSAQYVTCPCQYCNGGIEFDACGFEIEETRTVECPHCKMETTIFVPPVTSLPIENQDPPPTGNKDIPSQIANLRNAISKFDRSKRNARVMQMIGWVLCLTVCGAVVGIPIILITGNIVVEADAKRKAAEDELRVILEAVEAHNKEKCEAAFLASPEYYLQCAAALGLNTKTTPLLVEDFIGQNAIKQLTRKAYEAAREAGKRPPNVLLTGSQGCGKSTLALLIARAYANSTGSNFKVINGKNVKQTDDLATILVSLNESDLLFVDEIDQLEGGVEFFLRSAVVDFKLSVNAVDRAIQVSLPRFTLIATASDKNALSPFLLASFPVTAEMDCYSQDEITNIANKFADELGLKIEADAIRLIGETSGNSPKNILLLQELVRGFAQVREISEPRRF